MKVGDAIAEIMRREGIEILCGYPVNHLLEYAAAANIRPVIVRQERIGIHMADAISRVTSGRKIGAFCMQHGPGAENAYGGVAQCYSESIPLLVLPQGYPRRIANIDPNFGSAREMRGISKSAEPVNIPGEIANVMRRAMSNIRNGRSGPAIVEIPTDIWNEEIGELDYTPVGVHKYGPDPVDVRKAAAAILAAKRPVIYAGTGVQWAEAWPELREFAEFLGAPVTTSLGGKSSFPEDHELSLGSGGNAVPKPVHHFVQNADLIIGIGCSFTETNFGIKFPKGKKFVHATLDPQHLNKDVVSSVGLVGDAKLTLGALIGELRQSIKSNRDTRDVVAEIQAVKAEWMEVWRPLLQSNETPLSPYRVIQELMNTVDGKNTIITHDAGSPRDQISPFWVSTEPMSYIGCARPPSLAWGWALPWARSWPSQTSSASISGATPRSVSPAWTSRRRCVSGSPFCRSC